MTWITILIGKERKIFCGMDLDTIGLYSEKRPGEFPPPKAVLQGARVTLRPF